MVNMIVVAKPIMYSQKKFIQFQNCISSVLWLRKYIQETKMYVIETPEKITKLNSIIIQFKWKVIELLQKKKGVAFSE